MNRYKLRAIIKRYWFGLKSIFIRPDIADDPSYFDAVDFIKGKSYITYNQLQKGLNIGYARTAHILELLETNHKIGVKKEGREKRKVKI